MKEGEFVQITRRQSLSEEEFCSMVNAMYEQLRDGLLPAQLPTDGLSNWVRKNVVTPPDVPIPDCMTCGACCIYFPSVGVRPDEAVSPGDYWDITTGEGDAAILVDRYVRRDGETLACSCLEGQPGVNVTCRIYESRPKMCRDFEAGSDRCHAIRRSCGLEPFLTLDEMSTALKDLDGRPRKADKIKHVRFERETGTQNVKIMVLLQGESFQELHKFDLKNEEWRQFEFDGLSLAEAKELLRSRKSLEAK